MSLAENKGECPLRMRSSHSPQSFEETIKQNAKTLTEWYEDRLDAIGRREAEPQEVSLVESDLILTAWATHNKQLKDRLLDFEYHVIADVHDSGDVDWLKLEFDRLKRDVLREEVSSV